MAAKIIGSSAVAGFADGSSPNRHEETVCCGVVTGARAARAGGGAGGATFADVVTAAGAGAGDGETSHVIIGRSGTGSAVVVGGSRRFWAVQLIGGGASEAGGTASEARPAAAGGAAVVVAVTGAGWGTGLGAAIHGAFGIGAGCGDWASADPASGSSQTAVPPKTQPAGERKRGRIAKASLRSETGAADRANAVAPWSEYRLTGGRSLTIVRKVGDVRPDSLFTLRARNVNKESDRGEPGFIAETAATTPGRSRAG
jgi:hypothetical protein